MASTLYLAEWVRTRPKLSAFKASGDCTMCKRRSLAAGWHSVKTGEFRCARCFDAEQVHHDR